MRKSEIVERVKNLELMIECPYTTRSGLKEYLLDELKRKIAIKDQEILNLNKRLESLEKFLQVKYEREAVIFLGLEFTKNEEHKPIEYCKKCNQELPEKSCEHSEQ